MSGIEGKVVAITGASSGIGAATARLLAREGAKLVLGARREERLADLAGELGDKRDEVAFRAVDVRRREDLVALVALARERFGRLDVLVGNAGVGPVSPLDELRLDDWDAMIDINVKGILHGIAAALPVFRAQGHGQFIHTLSTAAYKTVPGQAVYSASKAAARTLTEGLRQEAGPSIRVSMVSPGFVATDFIESVPDPDLRARMNESKNAMAIAPEAVARGIQFAIEQPADVDVNEIIIRPTAQA
ncbi:SDR family oxidoreductase [Streptacidiphilus sp. PB12-B1b]|uniref:SDR family oxidoreductase n=1 Tax=Streptacidiphilus sp. PB12-B1b TaxID=2705012 RepID=UPI0015FA7C99|nr:SDR family oxidoreductase [Streptacidiphilus sp. PB12-B1b]QMU76904.1 SDR family oxidoreductase [Streptacidiphilus sp. PB12-B1b]